jgi:hypothetical protein
MKRLGRRGGWDKERWAHGNRAFTEAVSGRIDHGSRRSRHATRERRRRCTQASAGTAWLPRIAHMRRRRCAASLQHASGAFEQRSCSQQSGLQPVSTPPPSTSHTSS